MQSELWLRLLGLASPALFGALCGAAGLFARPSDAIATLNRYALTIGFPALVALGVARAELASAGSAGFWLLWPVAALIGLALIRRFGATSAAPLALVFVFGNVAYLGLPFTRAMLGDDAGVIAALLVAVHVSIAVSLGPYLLRAWSGRDTEGALRRVLKTPLVWAPLAGVALRALPQGPSAAAHAALDPLAQSAAPVALFLLGLYLHTERRRLRRPSRRAALLVVMRCLVTPLLVMALCLGALALDVLEPEHARVHVLLAAMPLAITTFSIALEGDAFVDDVGAAIVWSTALGLAALPAWTAIVRLVFPLG